jgi:hypothetical protein
MEIIVFFIGDSICEAAKSATVKIRGMYGGKGAASTVTVHQ